MPKSTGQLAAFRKAFEFSRKIPGSRVEERPSGVAVIKKGQKRFTRLFPFKKY
tara:strand:+ start:63 stop:221 length:159 start_codon:yes stop_codon:yes gene_type:complete